MPNNMQTSGGNLVGQVIKGIGGLYSVKTNGGEVIECNGRGKLRRTLGDIYIGDIVRIELYNNGNGVIEEVFPRKNCLIRPNISNLDSIVICIAPLPKPDFTLVDKLLINCLSEGIEPILCINKSDIADSGFIQCVHSNYDGLAEIVEVSTYDGSGIDKLLSLLSDKYVCFSGQSAVGKSSIINKFFGDERLAVGELSTKSERGKHCTRHIEIFEYGDIRIADTCGFSSLELPCIEPSTLSTYFSDFDEYADKCKFRGCNHIKEPGCAVVNAVQNGNIDNARYDRYIKLYNECDKQWRNRY